MAADISSIKVLVIGGNGFVWLHTVLHQLRLSYPSIPAGLNFNLQTY